MSKVHIARQGYLTKSAFPSITRSVPGGASVNSRLLLLGSGTNGSTTITDSSVNNYTMSQQAATPVTITNAQAPTGMSTSMYFAGGLGTACPRIYTPAGLPGLGTSDFCIEMYLRFTAAEWSARSSEKQCFWGGGDFTWKITNNGNNPPYSFAFFADASGSFPWDIGVALNSNFTADTWNHFALTRASNVFRAFTNGTQTWTLTQTVNIRSDGGAWRIGGSGVGSIDGWNGHLSNFRATIGEAIYTSNFTPPALPLANNVPGNVTITNNTYGVYKNY